MSLAHPYQMGLSDVELEMLVRRQQELWQCANTILQKLAARSFPASTVDIILFSRETIRMEQKEINLVNKQIYNIRGCLSFAINTEKTECFPGRYTQ